MLSLGEEEFVHCVLYCGISIWSERCVRGGWRTVDCALVGAVVAYSFARAVAPVAALYAVRACEVPSVAARLCFYFHVHSDVEVWVGRWRLRV